jgi:CheY-like chemotaxis protein
MKILIAEDESDISVTYKIVLEERGHEVIITENGEECLDIYHSELKRRGNSPLYSSSPFEVVVLDYKMPRKNGIEVAKEILDLNPNQRIIFASAYVRDTLEDAVKQLKRVVELLQKPFSPDKLVDIIEDKESFEGLKKLMVDVKNMVGDVEPTREQIKDLFESLRKIQKGKGFMQFLLSGSMVFLSSVNSLVI